MGIDPTHMSFERLSQALPPAYGEWVFGRACMAACESLYGVPRISFDEMRRDPRAARRTLSFWLRGADDAGGAAGSVSANVQSQRATSSCSRTHLEPTTSPREIKTPHTLFQRHASEEPPRNHKSGIHV